MLTNIKHCHLIVVHLTLNMTKSTLNTRVDNILDKQELDFSKFVGCTYHDRSAHM